MVLPAGYSLEVGHVFLPLLFLDSLQDPLFFLSTFPLIIFAVLLGKKNLTVFISHFEKKKKRLWKEV